jgi:hypothetical protein
MHAPPSALQKWPGQQALFSWHGSPNPEHPELAQTPFSHERPMQQVFPPLWLMHDSPRLRHGMQVPVPLPLQVKPRYGQHWKLSGPILSHAAPWGRQQMFRGS